MVTIGVTGGIGSGKSTVCKILETLGYPVFYADEVAKQNMVDNAALISSIVSAFGEEAYIDKQLNRNFLSKQIFSKPELREKLNSLVHPTVFQSYEVWKAQQNAPFIFNEAALMFETGSYKRFDRIWLVVADLETKIKRVMQRDGISRDLVEARMKNQLSDEEKMKFPCEIIRNSENEILLEQVLRLLKVITLPN